MQHLHRNLHSCEYKYDQQFQKQLDTLKYIFIYLYNRKLPERLNRAPQFLGVGTLLSYGDGLYEQGSASNCLWLGANVSLSPKIIDPLSVASAAKEASRFLSSPVESDWELAFEGYWLEVSITDEAEGGGPKTC